MHQVTWTSPESCDRSVFLAHGYRSSWLRRSVLCDNITEDTQTNVSSSLRRDLSKDTTKVVNQWVLCPHSYSEPMSFPGWMTQLQLYHQDPPSAAWRMAQGNQSLGVLRAFSRPQSSSQSISAVLTWMLEGGEGPRESGSSQGFPEAIKLFTVLPLTCRTFTPLLEHTCFTTLSTSRVTTSFPAGWRFHLEETATEGICLRQARVVSATVLHLLTSRSQITVEMFVFVYLLSSYKFINS